MHDVARLPAEFRRVHVRRTAIAGHCDYQKVHDGGHQDDIEPVAEDAIIQIDLRELGRYLTGLLQLPAPDQNADWDKQEPGNKQCRQEQEKDDAQIGVFVRPAKQLNQPVTDHGHTGRAGDGAAGKADRVVPEKQRRPYPVFTEFLKQCHFVLREQTNSPPL